MIDKYKNLIFIHTMNFILPMVILFGFYILINGEISPGGGFQAGAIFASLIIALDLSIGLKINNTILSQASAIGILIYLMPGIISLILGHNFLNYSALHHDPIIGQQIGILIVEMGIGITVSSSLTLIYSLFFD